MGITLQFQSIDDTRQLVVSFMLNALSIFLMTSVLISICLYFFSPIFINDLFSNYIFLMMIFFLPLIESFE